jgi:hypothetical protein
MLARTSDKFINCVIYAQNIYFSWLIFEERRTGVERFRQRVSRVSQVLHYYFKIRRKQHYSFRTCRSYSLSENQGNPVQKDCRRRTQDSIRATKRGSYETTPPQLAFYQVIVTTQRKLLSEISDEYIKLENDAHQIYR